ncbi:MAG: hypothetical protein N2447_03150 [Thermoanaerobaculum sp.]|nr:hypothetical protein [Thermoanaerobaculum sp.]
MAGFILEPVSWPVRPYDFDHTLAGEQGFYDLEVHQHIPSFRWTGAEAWCPLPLSPPPWRLTLRACGLASHHRPQELMNGPAPAA